MSDSVSAAPSNNAPAFGPVEVISSSELILDSNGSFFDEFGSSIAVNASGTMIVGAPQETISGDGSILIRQPDGQGGYHETKLTAPAGVSNGKFGSSIAINDAGVIAVGAKNDGAGGELYVYLPDENGAYGEPVKLAVETSGGSQLGSSVSISEDGTIVSGAPYSSSDATPGNGSVQVFVPTEDGGYITQLLEAPDAVSGALFGTAASINSSGLLIVGAPGDDDNGSQSGSVYVYQKNAEGLYQIPTKLVLPQGVAYDQFGSSVSVNEQGIIVVGAKGVDAGNFDAGSAYVYVPSEDGAYGEPIKLSVDGAAILDRAGSSIAISDDGVIVVGTEPGVNTAGLAYVFTPNGEGGYVSTKLVAPDGIPDDAFGRHVAIGSDGTIYVGAPGDDDSAFNAGSVYAFQQDVLGNYVHLSNELAFLESTDDAAISDSLELAFTDADVTDAGHSATVSSVSFTGVASGLSSLSNSELVDLLQVIGVTSSDNSVDGRVNLTFSAASSVFDYLAQDEQVKLTFTVELSDGAGGTATHPVIVTVVGTNDVPVVSDISASTSEDSLVEITPDFVDPDHSDTHTITFDATDTTGEVSLIDGKFHYDPDGQFDGLGSGESATDTFTYTINDGNGGVITKTVTVTINGTNDVPVVNDIDITVVQNTNVVIINADFSDVDINDTHIITIDNSTTVGVVINNGDGTFSYDCGDAFIHLSVGETATDTFTYTINDGNGGVITKTVTVTINGTNDVPVVNDIDITVVQNTNVVIINADFSDVDINDTHIITIDNSTTVGVVINNGDGTFSYDCGDAFVHLSVGETATDTFTYTINDGNGGVITKTVTVTINGTNDVPVVNDIDITVVQNTNVVIINADFSDVDINDTHIITIDNSTTVGVVINNGDGTFSYDCGDAFIHLSVGETATDTFTYTINDGNGGVITKTVTVTINGTNDVPVVNDIDITVVQNTNVVIINADFSDVDINDTHIITIDNSTTVGVVINNGDGTFSYDCGDAFVHLSVGESATDTFTYTVDDGNGGIVTKTVTITINGTDETPVVQGMIIIGDEHDNVLTGGQGNDTIQGKEGADVHNGGEGQDTAHYGNFSDLTSVSVINLADASENTGLATGDTYNSIENVIGSAGQDTIIGNSEANSLSGGRGDDVLIGGSGADILNGGSGTDTASYSDFTDEAVSSRINLSNSAQNTGVAAGDTYTSIENVIGSAGRDTIIGNAHNNELSGGLGNDSLYGGLGNDTLKGGEGNDYLRGDAGDDVLIGGLGDDNLQGGTGNDTYHYSLGDGNDTITETNSADQDRLILGDGITLENVQFTRVGRVVSRNKVTRENIDLELTFEDGSVLLIKDQFNANSNYGVEFIEFADGTVLSGYDILRVAYEDATDGADWLYGGSQDDVINGLGGNDIIVGGSGNDTIDGGEGSDTIRGEAGDDVLIGSEGNDGLYGGADNDTLKGGEGNDYLRGEAGDDILIGGLGDDNLQGGTGSDTYHYSLGDGNDTITETSSADQDRLILGEGITLENVQFTRVGRVVSRNKVTRENIDLELTFEDGSVLLIKDQFNANSNYGVEFIEFADGTVLSGYDILRVAYEDATDGADWLYGGSQDDVINGLGGNDIIVGGSGNDTIDGGEGSDTIRGEAGDDVLIGSEGNDSLYGGTDNDTLKGGEGNDYLRGEAGDDILIGGLGDDNLQGGTGSDTYHYSLGDGNDTITETSSADQDRLILGEGITLENVQFTRVGRVVSRNKVTRENIDLELTFEDGSVLLIKDQSNANSNYGVEFIEFADGTVLSGYDILRAAYEDATEELDWLYGGSQDDVINGLGGNDIIVGGSGNDTIDGGEGNDTIRGEAGDDLLIGSEGNDGLYGGADNDTLKGGEGDDYLRGEAGDDILIGGEGDDNLQGGTGSDTFVFMVDTAGHDIIKDFASGEGASDVIEFATSVFADFEAILAAAEQDGANSVITIDADTSITLEGVTLSSLHQDDFTFLG